MKVVFGHSPVQENNTALTFSKLCGNLSNCFWSYKRFLVDGVEHHSQIYDRQKERYNSAAHLKDCTLC